jgi:hypothetical protein
MKVKLIILSSFIGILLLCFPLLQSKLEELFLFTRIKTEPSKAKDNIRAFNRKQTAYNAEKDMFADRFDKLELGTPTADLIEGTQSYTYQMSSDVNTATITATSKDPAFKSYTGVAFKYVDSRKERIFSSIICESNEPTTTAPKVIVKQGNNFECSPDSQELEDP